MTQFKTSFSSGSNVCHTFKVWHTCRLLEPKFLEEFLQAMMIHFKSSSSSGKRMPYLQGMAYVSPVGSQKI
jgi:hypothetical protein